MSWGSLALGVPALTKPGKWQVREREREGGGLQVAEFKLEGRQEQLACVC